MNMAELIVLINNKPDLVEIAYRSVIGELILREKEQESNKRRLRVIK